MKSTDTGRSPKEVYPTRAGLSPHSPAHHPDNAHSAIIATSDPEFERCTSDPELERFTGSKVRVSSAPSGGDARVMTPNRAKAIALGVATWLLFACVVPAHGEPIKPPDPAPPTVFTLPLAPPIRVIHPFDGPAKPWLAGHRGVDLAANPGDTVFAPADGIVTFSGNVAGRWVMTIAHDPLRSSFETVTPLVEVGTAVPRGAPIATLAEPPETYRHCYPEHCLHWGVRRGDVYLDPMALLGDRPPIILKPLGG